MLKACTFLEESHINFVFFKFLSSVLHFLAQTGKYPLFSITGFIENKKYQKTYLKASSPEILKPQKST